MGFVVGPIEITEIEGIETMPAAVTRIAAMLDDPTADATAFGRVVELDPVLTADVLRLANSAWSSPGAEVLTARDAIMRLGAAVVLKLAVGKRVASTLRTPNAGYDLDHGEMWRHAVAAALAAEKMATYASIPVPGASFTAALLHDIGKVPLNNRLGPDGLRMLHALVDAEDLSYLEAEQRLLGTDHAEAGAMVIRHWGLPEQLAVAVANHHDPDLEPGDLDDAVHMANVVAKLIGVGLGCDGICMNMSDGAAQRLGLTTDKLEGLCAEVSAGLAEATELFGGED